MLADIGHASQFTEQSVQVLKSPTPVPMGQLVMH
jgi:hypothetical protein